jgi:hypothetical protein
MEERATKKKRSFLAQVCSKWLYPTKSKGLCVEGEKDPDTHGRASDQKKTEWQMPM